MTMHIHLFNPNSPLWTQSSTEQSPHQFSYLHLQRPFLCTSSWDFWKHNFFTAQVKKKSFKKKVFQKKKSFNRTQEWFSQILDYIFLKSQIFPLSRRFYNASVKSHFLSSRGLQHKQYGLPHFEIKAFHLLSHSAMSYLSCGISLNWTAGVRCLSLQLHAYPERCKCFWHGVYAFPIFFFLFWRDSWSHHCHSQQLAVSNLT